MVSTFIKMWTLTVVQIGYGRKNTIFLTNSTAHWLMQGWETRLDQSVYLFMVTIINKVDYGVQRVPSLCNRVWIFGL